LPEGVSWSQLVFFYFVTAVRTWAPLAEAASTVRGRESPNSSVMMASRLARALGMLVVCSPDCL